MGPHAEQHMTQGVSKGRACSGRKLILLFLAILAMNQFEGGARAQSADEQADQQDQGQAEPAQTNPPDAKNDAQPDEKKGEWLLAPIPISSPAVGTGLQWAVGRVFHFDKSDEISPPSTVGIGGVFTNNGTRAFAIGGRLYLKQDKYRVTAALGTASVNFDIYGVGRAAGDRGTFVPLNTDGKAFIMEPLFRLKKGVYLGLRGQYRDLRLSLDQQKLDSSSQPPDQLAELIDTIAPELLQQRTVSVGPRFQWDTRDNVFYPKRGILLDFGLDLFAQALGSKWNYQYYKVSFNKYTQLSEHQVLAFRGMACAATGDHVPIYDLCLFGTSNDIRGYAAGRFQDRRMFAAQAEYRLMLPVQGFLGRFGVVAFAGFGGVDKKFTDMGFSDLLPGGGAGVRFRLTKKNPINFRADYAIGKVGNTFSMGVLEAF
jgi:Omp85 superfamily domain